MSLKTVMSDKQLNISKQLGNFLSQLLASDSLKVENKAQSPLASRALKVFVPVVMAGLAAGLNVAQAATTAIPFNAIDQSEHYSAPIDPSKVERLVEQVELGQISQSAAQDKLIKLAHSYTGVDRAADLSLVHNELMATGYQSNALADAHLAFNQTVMDDAGNTIHQGKQTAVQKFSSQVWNKPNAAGWAAAAFSIAEGLARISGHNELADQAYQAQQFSNKSDNYYRRGKNDLNRGNPMQSAKGLGQILNEIGRDAERARRQNQYGGGYRY